MIIKALLYTLSVIAPFLAISQLQISEPNSIEQAVLGLAGDGVVISNILYSTNHKSKDDNPIGVFSDSTNSIGLKGGLVMTTGSAKLAGGLNTSSSSGQGNSSYNQYVPELANLTGGNNFFDVCIVEFDIKVSSNKLSFNYVFGSEEYPEWVNDFNDAFGFFISGPGIFGSKNIATLPHSSTPVSINTINDYSNSLYYINNGDGYSTVHNSPIQYDGYTTPLQAETDVIPCQTYHIKLIIADSRDEIYDSGVFIEANSFSSQNKPIIEVSYENPRFDYAIEGCNNVTVKITRGELDLLNLNKEVEYYYNFEGTATPDIDFIHPNEYKITIPKGAKSASFDMTMLPDNKEELIETIIFNLNVGCSDFEKSFTYSIELRDQYDYNINNQITCYNEPLIINDNPDHKDIITWLSPNLSCQNCLSPTILNNKSSWYHFDAEDPNSGCKSTDSVYIFSYEVVSDFTITQPACKTTQERTFTNNSKNAHTYFWDFGDGLTSTDTSINHQFGEWFITDQNSTFNISLIAYDLRYNCSDTLTKPVTISDFVFIPNIITPNYDEKNDFFTIKGFSSDCWTLSVYDRWGGLVHEAINYQNDWGGEDLSDGTYFYSITNSENDQSFKGQILIIR